MAESKYALTYAGESGNATDGFSLPDNLGKPLQDLNVTLALASVDIRLLTGNRSSFASCWQASNRYSRLALHRSRRANQSQNSTPGSSSVRRRS